MKISIKAFGLLLIIIALSGCNNNNNNNNDNRLPDNFDYGHVENGVYQNEYFDFSMKLPDDWVVQSKEQTEYIANTGKKIAAGDDKNLQAVVKASDISSANLLAVFQYEVGSAVEYNPAILIVAENVKNAPGIKNGSDYLFQARRLLQQAHYKYDYLSEDFDKERINESDFYKMEARINTLGLEITQIYYSTVLKGFSFNVIISYISDEQKKILLESINTMKFKK